MAKVYNKHHNNAPDDAVFIGNGSPFAKKLAKDKPLLKKIKKELKGRDLVCFCAPKPCHGDIILVIANSE